MVTGLDPDLRTSRTASTRPVGGATASPTRTPRPGGSTRHGTHVAGTIASRNAYHGVDAPGTTLVGIRSQPRRLLLPQYVACGGGFDWAADHGIDVTNSSYTWTPYAFWMPTEGSQAAGLEAASRTATPEPRRGERRRRR